MIKQALGAMKEITKVEGDGQVERVLNSLIESHNFLNTKFSIKNNTDSQLLKITFAAGERKKIAHSLGVVPLYRIILRQEGNGVISDIPSGWTKNTIELINNGAVSVTVIIAILRE